MKSAKLFLAVLLLSLYVSAQQGPVIYPLEERQDDGYQQWQPPQTVPNTIKIGTLQCAGTLPNGQSSYDVHLDTTGITAAPLTFGNVRLHVNGLFEDTAPQGPITTPAGILYIGAPFPPFQGLGSCLTECVAIVLQLFTTDGKPMTFTLANGQQFTTWGVNTTIMYPRVGKTEITTQQIIPIYLSLDKKGL